MEFRFSSLAFLSPASIATIHGTSLTLTKDASSSSTAAHSRRFVDRPPAEATAPAAMESPQSLARRILSTSATDDDDSCAFPRTRDRAALGSSASGPSSSFESTSMPPSTSRLPHVCERRAASSSSSSELIDDDVSASTSISAGLGVGAAPSSPPPPALSRAVPHASSPSSALAAPMPSKRVDDTGGRMSPRAVAAATALARTHPPSKMGLTAAS